MASTNHKFLYTKVFVALLFLTFITVWIAQFDFGNANGIIAMAVASVKATLVGMYFMHLNEDKKLYAVILVAGFLFLLILLGFTSFDIGTRALEQSTL